MRRLVILCLLASLLVVTFACSQPAPTPPSPTATSKPVPTTTAAPSPTATATPTATAKPSPTATAQSYDIRVAAAGIGTGSYTWSLMEQQMLTKYYPEIKLKVLPTAGGDQNVQMLKAGDADIAASFSYLDGKQADWWNGVKTLYPYLPIYSLVIVKKDSPIKTWQDLKGKTICPSPKGATGTIYWERVLTEGFGWQPDKDFKLIYAANADMAGLLRQGTVDALMAPFGLNTPYTIEVFNTMDVRLIELPADIMDKVQSKYYPPNSYPVVTIPAGTLKGITAPFKTWVAWYAYMIKASVPDDVAAKLAMAVWDHKDEAAKIYNQVNDIRPADMFSGPWPVPLHPGVLKYFQSKGWVK